MEQEQDNQTQEQSEVNPQAQKLQELASNLELLKQQNQQLQDKLATKADVIEQPKAGEESEIDDRSMKELLGFDAEANKPTAANIEELSNKELVMAISDAVEHSIQNAKADAAKTLGKNLKESNDRIQQLQNVVLTMVAKQDIAECVSKYPDFNSMRKDIQVELQQTPGISIEKAYLLVKAQKAAQSPSNRQLVTERPTDALNDTEDSDDNYVESKPKTNKRQSTTPASGIVDFRTALESAVGRVIDARRKKGPQ